MHKKANAGDALNQVVREYGIPEQGLHTANAREESSDHMEWEKVRKHFLILQTLTEPHSPWMNQAEGEISWLYLKTHNHHVMNSHHCPETLWCFGIEYTSALHE